MPLWNLQVLLIAGCLIQQSALPIYAQTNFALYQEVFISSNDTCGLQENDEFCSAIDNLQRCHELDFCSAQCPFGESITDSVDLVATGIFHGEVTLVNHSSTTCNQQGTRTVQLNGTNGFISKSPEVLPLFNESPGLTLTIHLSQKPGDSGNIVSKEDNRSLVFALSANSSNQQLCLEYLNVSGLRSNLLVNYSLADGHCHHVALVLFSSTIQLYIDAILVAEEITYQNLWNRSGSIFLGGTPYVPQDQYFEGEFGSARLYAGPLVPSEISADATGRNIHKPRLATRCRCHVNFPSVTLDVDGLYCVNPKNNKTARRVNEKAHFAGMANDGDLDTWWQSKTTRVPLNFTVSLGTIKQVLVVNISFKWWPPRGLILLKSADNGATWIPWQYFAQDCRATFNMEARGKLYFPNSVNCIEGFSYPVPGETVPFYLLQSTRPGADSFETNRTLQEFSFATHVRLSMVSYLGNSQEKTDYFAITEIEIYGRNCSCPFPTNISSCQCEGAIARPPKCNETLKFDSERYTRSIFDQTPTGVAILQVHARSLCVRSAPVSYFITERNDSGSFHIESTTGVFKLRSHVLLNSTFQFLVEARLQNAEHPINNSTAPVLIQVVARDTLNSRTIVNFKTEKLGFLQRKPISNRAQQFGFFVNGYPESGGSLQAFVGEVSTEVNYTTTREQAMHVKAVLVNSDVYWDRPVVRVIAQVQDPSYNVRTLVDDSEVVVKVIPSANLSMIDGRLLQSIAKPSAASGIAEVEVPLPSQWFSDPSLVNPEVVTITYRLRNTAMPPTLLGNATIHPQTNTQLFTNDVYSVLPLESVFVGEAFSFSIYCDSSYAVASFGIKLVVDPFLVIVKSHVDGQRWVSVAVNHSSSEWVVSATLTDPESAPEGVVKKLITFEVKVKEMAVVETNATIAAEVAYLSNVNNEEIQIGGQSLPVMAAMVDGLSQTRHTVGTIRIASNDIQQLIPYAEPSVLVNTAVINGQMVEANIKLLAVRRSGDVTILSEANCTSLTKAVQVSQNCSKVFLNGSEPEGSPEARVQVEYGHVKAIVTVRVWFPVLPLNLTLNYPELAEVSGWLEFKASSGKCGQRYQWSEVHSEALFTYDGIHFENVSTTSLVRDLLSSLDESVAFVDGLGNVYGTSPGRATIKAVNSLNGVFLGSAELTVTSLRRVSVQVIDIVMVTNLSVSIPAPPYPRLSTQMAIASVHQDLRRDHTRGALVACVTFSDGRRQKLNSDLGLHFKSLDDHVLRITGQSEAISVGSGAGMLQADWVLPASVCYLGGFSLGVGYEMTNVSLSAPIRLEISGVSPQITVPGDKSTIAGVPTSSDILVTLVFENEHRVDMSSDSRTVYDLSNSEGFFTVHRDHNNVPVIKASSLGKFGRKNLMVRFTHFAISGTISVNIVTYIGLALHAKPYPPYPESPQINSLSRIADTSSHEMASLSLAMVLSDASNYDITRHALTSFSSSSSDVIVIANRVTVRPGVTSTSAVIDGSFSGVGNTDMFFYVRSSPVYVNNITDFVLSPGNNGTLSGVENSPVAQVELSLTFSNGRRVTQFYDGGTAFFPGLITLASENIQVFTVDSSTGQITLRRNYHQTLFLNATAAVSMVTSSVKVACNLLPAIGDVDLGEERGLPLPPRNVGSLIQIPARLNAGEGSGVKKIDLTLSYDQAKLTIVSVIGGSAWENCVPDLSTPGQISLDCISDSSLSGLVEVADITFNATRPGLTGILGSVTTDILGTSSLVAGDVDQEIISSGKRRRRSLDDRDRRDVLEAHKHRMRRSLFCAIPPCQCNNSPLPGDVNRDCLFDLSDVIFVLRFYSFSIFNFSNAAANLLVQSLTSNQSRDLDVDKNTVVNPADAFYLVRALLGLVRFVSVASVTPVQVLSSDCQLSFSVTLMSKNGPVSDVDTFVFFDITYKGSPIDFAGSTGSQRGVGIYGNLIRGISLGNGSFGVQSPFQLIQDSLGFSVFHVTLDSKNQTSYRRLSALLGNPRPPYLFPFRLSVDLQVSGQILSVNTNTNYNPFVAFNNTLSSADCINNFTPQFEELLYHTNISEDATVNSLVITVNATDLDHGDSGRIIYRLVSDEALPFAVNSTSGVIRIVRSLDREERAWYNLTVRATDGGALGREKFAHAYVFVLITDVNDNAPVVTKFVPGHVTKIPENAVVGNPLARVIASDADVGENARLGFSIVGNSSSNGTFIINETTGEVMLNSSLQGKVGDIFKIIVLISDHGFPALTTNTTVEFWVTYATDVEIFFTSQFYEANLTENSPDNTSVVQVTAYVPGLPLADIVYSVRDNVAFKIDSNNGVVLVNSTIDREASDFFFLIVTAHYGQNISTNATVNITVLDENDNAPIPNPVPLRVIPYNLPAGSRVWRVNASDRDIGRNAVLKFYLLEEAFNLFVINKESGEIFLNSSLLDLNESFVQLSIEVSDSGVPALSANVTVNISILFPPRFSRSDVNITLPEDISIGNVVYTFTAMNISGQHLDIYFTISYGNFGEKVSIRNLSGEVFIQESLDREEISFYSLSIQASNLAAQRFTEIQTTELLLNITVLDVNDNAPYLEAIQPITIKNTAHVGYTLLRVNASDADEGLNAQLHFRITSGNELHKFVINELGSLQLNGSLLYDSVPWFFLTINVSDLGSPVLYNTTGINITVEDDRSPPRFNRTFYNVSILEDIALGSEVVTVFAADPNGDRIFYNISSTFANVASIFKINSSTGIITTVAELDREIQDTYEFEINAYKYSPLTGEKYLDNASITVRISDVNDVRPQFELSVYTVELDEENSPGVVLVSIHANDTDQGINSLLSYTIISGNQSIFSLNSSSGKITVLISLDYETLHQLNLTVQAKDHGTPPLEANASVVVNIRDINDNTPVIVSNLTYNITLLESVQQGTFVVQINATDADSGQNSNLSFSFVGGNLYNVFSINPTNGLITTASQLDYEKEKFYALNVSVQDQGSPPLQSSILITVEVIDVNDVTPVIYPLSPVYVRENVPVDTVITQVNATDGDSGMNAALNFTIASGNQAGDFIINETSGVITTAHALDHENVSSYILNISVIDNGIPPLSSDAVVIIYIIDVNDHRPIFSQDLYEASIYEDVTVNSTILRVHARDLDSSTADGIVYSVRESNDNDTFMLNSSSGEIKLARSLDFEETKHYLLVVKATDTFLPNDTLNVVGAANDSNSSISFFSFVNVSLLVLDVNDNPPRFSRDFYSVLIDENLPAGSLVARVNATDEDSGVNAEVAYELLSSSLATELFVVNGSSGEVTTKVSLRDANYLTIDLSIIALDKGMPPLNNTTLLQVRIDYNVTFKYNNTYPLTYVVRGALQVEPPVMLSSVCAETHLGLFSQTLGDLQVTTGNIQRAEMFEVLKEPALYIKAALVSDWPDYQVIRIAVQAFDRNFNVKTAPTKVHFKLINLDTDLEINIKCIPSTNTGICVGRLLVPQQWLNTSTSASVQYGLLLSNLVELRQVSLRGRPIPQVEGNFVILAPLYLLNVGDEFLLEVYAQYPNLVNFYTLIFTVSTGLKINGVQASPLWSVQTTFNGANEFAVFGVRKSGHSEDISATAELYFTIKVEIAENTIMVSPETMECTVSQVSDQQGNQLIGAPVKAVFEDRFGRNETGRFVVVEDGVKALFVAADFSVIINTAVLNGRRIDIPLVVYGVTASGRVLNVTSVVTCRSLDAAVLKVSSNCSSVYVNGSETRGSTEVIIEFSLQNLATNYSFIVWKPTIPISLSVTPTKLKRIHDWYDPGNSCKSRYQHARVTVTAEFSDGKQSYPGVDVTQHVKNNFKSSNISVAETVGLNIHGKSVGKATIEVYNSELFQSLGDLTVEVTNEETRVYILDAIIATRIFVVIPKSLNNSLQHAVSVNIDQKFSIPEDEGSVLVSLQYSDGLVNTFDNLRGFHINSTNNSVVTVQEKRITAVNDGSGDLLHVVMHSGHCTLKPTFISRADVDVDFQEPVAVLTLSSRQITPRGDPAEAIGVSLSTELTVTLVYNISGREYRVDVTNDNRTIYNLEVGDNLVSFVVIENMVVVSASGAGFGQVIMSVKFTHVQSSGRVAFDVIGAQELTFYASPHPAFNSSMSVNVTQLNPIGNSGEHQQARLNLILILTNGTSRDISRDARVRFEIAAAATQPAELARNSFIKATDDGYHVVSVQWRSEKGQLSINGSFIGMFSHVITLTVDSSPVTVTSLEVSMPPNFTLSGLRDRATLQLSVNLQFSDDSKLLGLFSSQNKTLFDLVTFSTQDTTKISLNETSGSVTLKANSPREVHVTVSALQSPSIKDSFAFACNLDPDVGDVDIGDVTGVPLKLAHVGESFVAPVRINSGNQVLGSFNVEIVYDSELLEVVSVNEGADMTGFFVADKSSQTGKVRIAGALSIEVQDDPVLHVADVKFRVMSSGTARVSGTVLMIAADDLVGSVIGLPVPRNIVAGDIEVTTDNNMGRQRRSFSSAPRLHPQSSIKIRKRRSAVACPNPPCVNCTNGKREPGDTDGNCIFDIRDVKFTLTYMTERQFSFSRVKGKQIQDSITPQQLQALDANGDGSVTLNDVNLLLRANLQIVSLFPTLTVIPVQDPNSKCLLTISVSASQLGLEPSDANRTTIFFDVSHSEQNFSNSLGDSVFTTGALDIKEKGIPGGMIRAEFKTTERRFVASLNTSLLYSRIGLSFVQVRFANDGSLDLTGTAMVNGLFTWPPLYRGVLNATLDLGNGRRYSIRRPNGYNPYTFFSNALASSNCSDDPLLGNDIALEPLGARNLLASWTLANVRRGLNFSFILRLRLCDPAQSNEPCEIRALQLSGTNHTVTGLRPYTNYSVKVETTGLPLRETRWEDVRTLESVPEGVDPPTLEVSSCTSLNASWTEPEHPNGVIISYSLHMRNLSSYSVLYQGSSLSYHVTGLSAGQEYFFYIMANTSVGGTKSSVVSASVPLETIPSSGARDTNELSVEVIVGITIGSAAFIALLIILLVWLVRRHIKRKQPSMLDYRTLHKYNSLDVNSTDNLAMELRSTSSLRESSLARGRMYEHNFSIDGLENPWKGQELNDSGQDPLAAVNHRHFEPGSARTQNWDPGYEETVLKEAAQEMNELDVAMKENLDTLGRINGFSGQQSSLREDNLVHMTTQSRSQSSFSPENTSRKKSKKKKGDDTTEWDYYYARSALTEADHFGIEETKSRGQIRKARLLAEEILQRLASGEVNKEFRELAAERTEGTYLCANDPVNMPKNRYKNILPFDHSRVSLDAEQGQEDTDYINANFLDGFKQKNSYIATQGPLNSTITDFWQMVWEQNVHVIVMLTRLQEGKKVKCVKYWPDTDEEVTFGDFVITSTYKRKLDSRVVRRFLLENSGSGECREIMYFQFTAWPDFGIPSSPADFLELYYEVMREYKSLSVPGTPILVHCSAGVGRSGAFCAINNCLQSFRSTGKIDLAEAVRDLRKQRSGMVQTLEQYAFCYKSVVLALLYQIKLKKLKGISLLSQSAASSSPRETSNDTVFNQSRPQSPGSGRSQESVTSQNAPPYSYSQRLLPPVGPCEEPRVNSDADHLPTVVVHSTPKKFLSKQDSFPLELHERQGDGCNSTEVSHGDQRNLEVRVGETGRRKTTGNIRRRPDLGEPPPPPPPPPPSILPNEHGFSGGDSLPVLPEVDYPNSEPSEDDDEPFPSPPEAFCLPVEAEQPNQFVSSA